ncbi:MAG: GGDEF domain-containing protein [Chloroflexi bacterium]|nr:GGDEF domain-containing protein [Chloroflexota bacterium]
MYHTSEHDKTGEIVHSLAAGAFNGKTLEKYFGFFCELLSEVVPFDCAQLFTRNGSWGESSYLRFEFNCSSTPGAKGLKNISECFATANTVTLLVASTGQPAMHESLREQSYRDLQQYHGRGLNSSLAVPLIAGEEIGGVLLLMGCQEGQFQGVDLDMVQEATRPLAYSLRHTLLQETLEQVRQRLNEAEKTDWLTRLNNRRHFLQMAEAELARSKRYGQKFSFLFMDVDRFRDVNARFGHRGGDEALKHLALVLRRATRSFDIVGRYGGEEFAIILPQTDRSAALSVAGRLCAELHAQPVRLGLCQEAKLSASIGVSVFPEDALTIEALMQLADGAMYKAKQSGGNGAATA